jgi:uncharacterized protein YndB with AHSA1/START domain
MIKGEGDIVVKRPIEEVWKFLTDFENYPKWHKGMATARQTSTGPTSAGTTVEVVAEILGRHTIKLVITDFDPNKKIAWMVDARPLTGEVGYVAGCTFESV